jgi:chromate transporter
MKSSDPLLTLAANFAMLSLFAIGGANAAIPEMHRLVVETHRWMTDQQFSDLFAISQITPGPNVIITTLIGYQVAGFAGALVATVAMCGPTCLATFFVTKVWDRFRDAPLRMAIQAGLVPVSVGLLAASAWVLLRTVDTGWVAVTIAASTAIIGYFTKINPLRLFAAAAFLGAAGLV